MNTFYSAPLAFLPDPVRDDRLTVGVLVVSADGKEVRFRRLRGIKTRLRALAPWTHSAAIEQLLDDLADAARQSGLWFSDQPLTLARLEHLAASLGNQLQLGQPKPFRAESIDQAIEELAQLHLPTGQAKSRRRPTRQALRERIRKTVAEWDLGPYRLESSRIRVGPSKLPHQADFWLVNGTARAALYALADDGSDLSAIVLRDSLPVVLQDFRRENPHFAVVAVTADEDHETHRQVEAFLAERQVRVATDSELHALEAELITRLIHT